LTHIDVGDLVKTSTYADALGGCLLAMERMWSSYPPRHMTAEQTTSAATRFVIKDLSPAWGVNYDLASRAG
jgi:hypothetical protein